MKTIFFLIIFGLTSTKLVAEQLVGYYHCVAKTKSPESSSVITVGSWLQWSQAEDVNFSFPDGKAFAKSTWYRSSYDPQIPGGYDDYLGVQIVGPEGVYTTDMDNWGGSGAGRSIREPRNNPTFYSIACANYTAYPNSAPELNSPKDIKLNPFRNSGHSCAIDGNQIKCWGRNDLGQVEVPNFVNPTSLSVGLNHSCALDAEGARCWGSNKYNESKVPELVNPIAITAGWERTCAIDKLEHGSVLKCWGNGGGGGELRTVNPREVALGQDRKVCVIDDEGVKCRGWFDQEENMPILRDPHSMSIGNLHACALTFDGPRCWSIVKVSSSDSPELSGPQLEKNVKLVRAIGNRTCATSDKGFQCWGEIPIANLPQIPNDLVDATTISLGPDKTCVISDENLKC